ncbi:hypothetical protein C0991_012032 [Blastosporella zonata]|nr:hypothetical protein C0991_012032 [Blastosporella zonata]
MLSLVVISLCSLLAQCVPRPNVEIVGDAPQVKFSAMKPLSNATSIPFYVRPAITPDPPKNNPGLVSSRPLLMAYYSDWVDDSFRPEDIPCLFDWVDFAFAVPTEKMDLSWDEPDSAPGKLRRLVSRCRVCQAKVKLSIGGWTGSKYFSSAVRTAEKRLLLANNVLTVFNTFKLDGIDLDWEYPGRAGADGNQVHPDDSKNFFLFLRSLRSVLPAGSCITAAAQTVPFTDGSGEPMEDLSQFAAVLDWAMLMNYDAWDSSPFPGPNAPLYDACQNSTQPDSNAVAAVNKWTAAGFPLSQLVLGVPSYGYLSSSNAQSLRQRRGRRWLLSQDYHTLSGPGVRLTSEDNNGSGQIMFRQLVKQGALVLDCPANATNPATFVGAGGFTRYWDSCSGTPFLRSSLAEQVVAYDDPESLAMKTKFAACLGMRGVNMFDTHGDTEQGDLVLTIKDALGFNCSKS